MSSSVSYVTFKVDGEFITDFIRNLYYKEDLSYQECKFRLEKSLCLGEMREDDKEKLFQDILYGKKKLVGINEFDLVDDVDFDIYKYSRFPRPTFEEGKGVRGILTTDGIFVYCNYGGHFKAIEWLGEKSFGGMAFYLHDYDTSISGVSADYDITPLTERQLEWLEKHRKYLVPKQLKDLDMILHLNSRRW